MNLNENMDHYMDKQLKHFSKYLLCVTEGLERHENEKMMANVYLLSEPLCPI